MERKIVALMRKYFRQLKNCNGIEYKVWEDNLDNAFAAAESKGMGELADATIAKENIDDPEYRRAIFEFMPNPLAYYHSQLALIEKYKEYL